jgi:hypothetical protein
MDEDPCRHGVSRAILKRFLVLGSGSCSTKPVFPPTFLPARHDGEEENTLFGHARKKLAFFAARASEARGVCTGSLRESLWFGAIADVGKRVSLRESSSRARKKASPG